MWLRTTAGAYAGQIRDYPYLVAVSALRNGTAVRIDIAAPSLAANAAPVIAIPSVVTSTDPMRRRAKRVKE